MKPHDKAPNGHFAGGLILYGNLESGGIASKGFLLEPPDLNNASIALLNEFQDKIRIFLSSLGPKQRAQIQWTCNSDYRRELMHYQQQTPNNAPACVQQRRNDRFVCYWQRMQERSLRKEQLVLFISREIESYPQTLSQRVSLHSYYEKTLRQLQSDFDETQASMSAIFGSGTALHPMSDVEHFDYYVRFLNPSLADRLELDVEQLFHPDLTLQEQCWHSDGVGVDDKTGFYLDGHYHSVFSIKRWPQKTYPGIIHRLTGLPFLDYQITANLTPIPARKEIQSEEKAMDRLRGDYREEGKHSIAVALQKKERKIESLAQGFTVPFQVQYLVRVWDKTESGLHSKCAAIKNAINTMNGAQAHEASLPTTSKKLFFASWPGWTHSSYTCRNLYAEDRYLADVLPMSSTFTAHLEEAEAIYDGTNGNLVGVKTFVGNTPQHSVLIGMTGAGKSVFMEDLLFQTQPYYGYTVLVEEGFSYKNYTESLGEKPIVVHPDGEITLNYLDTQGLPLTQLHLASAVALVSRMIGESSDLEKQQLRQAQIGQYLNQLYEDSFEEWSRRHPEKVPVIHRMACAVHGWRERFMEHGTTLLEAFAEFREKLNAGDGQAFEFLHELPEETITRFIKEPKTERFVMTTACAFIKPEEHPTHSALIDLMFHGRFQEHRKEEIDGIATLLTAWTSRGQYGKLFDGSTNLSLTGKVAHFELGFIPEQAVELKTAAGLLISGFTRQHIITLPRSLWKRIIFEEVARFLDVPGGEKIVAESYAQLRKFNCWTLSVVQQYGKFKSSRIRPVVMGNSKQFLLMRQLDRSDLTDISSDIGLPEVTVDAIQHYPLPEQQVAGTPFSSLCYFSPAANPPLCGTLRHVSALSPSVIHNPTPKENHP